MTGAGKTIAVTISLRKDSPEKKSPVKKNSSDSVARRDLIPALKG
jgi:hypothetical protein